ncbi:OmpA family protein [Seohaeicola sp. SP36]|uniref:OmpA family protein n=1 Tax=unclassified Seohaeicola TaxID=2641111 RepID=UPI00237A0C1A|nr:MULTISPECIES: OmpA family protein [unclassified Seohaeicola]MDD9707701.1 OmpA family protein [Seohaeicola sp. 4SK31]MDD9735943.1 OmpA family protein [Seohaeicola sp. SP36]
MTRRTLKTTTASILALSLIQPYPAMAQLRALNPQAAQHSSANTGSERIFLAQAEDATCFTDGEVDTARCDIDMMRAELEALLENGLPDAADRPAEDELTAALTAEERIGLLSAAIEDAEREASLEAETVANAEAEATVAAEAEAAARAEAEQAAAAQAAAEETALKEAEAAAAAEAEAAMAAEAEAEAAARADAEEAAAAGAAAEEAAAAEAARLAQAEAEADAAVEAEAAATAEAEAATEAETTAEGEVSADAEAEALREALTAAEAADAVAADTAETDSGEAEPAPEATAEAEMETPVEAEAPAEDATTDTAAEEVPADTGPVAEAPAEEAPVEATSTPQAETLVTSEEETEASALKDAEILAEQEAAQTLGAVASALAGEEAGEPAGTTDGTASDADPAAEAEAESEVTTEVVTEQDVRSSDEEFAAPAISSAAAPQAVEADRDSGLSNLEKAGLLALGALAVGAIMSNGQRVAATSGDRVIVEDNSGRFQVLKDDDALLRRPGSTVETRRFNDGSTTTTTTREDGSRVVTIRDASGRVLRRSVFDTSGRETLLIDDITTVEPVNVATLPPAPRMNFAATDRDALEAALREAERRDLGRTFSLRQVREIVEVRDLAPQISLEDVTFRSGSAAIEPSQAEQLREIGNLMRQMIRENPREVFLIEGYTDAVGGAASNLLLSDRRAESVALALTEYFDVPPENMVVQGFGERFLKIPTLEAERQNRRVAVRWITDLIAAR